MIKFFNYAILLTLGALLHSSCIDGKAVPVNSHIDDIKLSYKDGIWHCDRLTCPKNRVFGCKILHTNDVNDKKILLRTNICYKEDNSIFATFKQSEVMHPVKTVDINITSFIGAESVYTTGYSRISQNFNGTVAVDDWENVQQVTRDNMKVVDESEWD